MPYRKTFDPEAYGEYKPIMEKLILGGPGTKIRFTVTNPDRSIHTAAQRLREFIKLNPNLSPTTFTVRIVDAADRIIEVEYKKKTSFGIAMVEEE